MSGFRSFAIFAVSGFLAACQTPSPELQTLHALAGQEQLAYARALPLEERLDLYHELYVVKGHPRNNSLAIVFDDSGQAGYDAVMRRITSRNAFYEYVWVLKAVDRGGLLDLCGSRYMGQILRRATDVGLRARDLTHITFRRCALAEGDAA